jgi:metallophosphoesterase (TIGR00282 family)
LPVPVGSSAGKCYEKAVVSATLVRNRRLELRILYIGEIVGSSGVFCVKQLLPELIKERSIDFVIANGDGATGGFGIGKSHAVYLHKLGINVLTSGECIYYKKDMVPHLSKAPYLLRPLNYPYGNPGRGWACFQAGDQKIAVINVLGQASFRRVHLANPFLLMTDLLARIRQETGLIVLDFHAATTAEKNSMFYHLDGQVSAVLGSHSKVLTADERILPGGTAVITDTGRTGSSYSVGGLDPEIEIRKLVTQIHEHSKAAWKKLELQGVLLDIDAEGKALAIERIKEECEGAEDDRESYSA